MRNTYTALLGLFTLLFLLPVLSLLGRAALTGFGKIEENTYAETLANPVTLLGGLLGALWIVLKLTTSGHESPGRNNHGT
ncbi:hypothetical protein GCM10027174_43550 [Salinifilum aidingensis]